MSSFTRTVAEGRRSGKAPEKSSFSQTCSLLSQFLKEKRASVDSNLGIGVKMEPRASTKDLLGSLQNSEGALRLNTSSMDFLPQLMETPGMKKSNVRTPCPEFPQMTIFYGGKLLVFNAFPPEKATEVMELATKLASDESGGGGSGSTEENPPSAPVTTEKLAVAKVPEASTSSESPKPGVGSDMRYPRRASLLKFLEKRKERVNAKGPYQINNHKAEGSTAGGEPEDSSKQFDLNL